MCVNITTLCLPTLSMRAFLFYNELGTWWLTQSYPRKYKLITKFLQTKTFNLCVTCNYVIQWLILAIKVMIIIYFIIIGQQRSSLNKYADIILCVCEVINWVKYISYIVIIAFIIIIIIIIMTNSANWSCCLVCSYPFMIVWKRFHNIAP